MTRATIHDRYLSTGFLDVNKGDLAADTRKLDLNYAEYLPADRETPILDVGCGMGHFLHYLEQKGYRNLLGIDASTEAIGFCRTRIGARLDLVTEIPAYLATHERAFGLVVLKDVIEHLPREEVIPILSAIHGALRPGGTLLIETGNMASFTGPYLYFQDFTHQSGFTEVSLRQVLMTAGFERMEIRGNRRALSLKDRVSAALWTRTLRWIYRTERGKSGVPAILEKLLIAAATREL